MPLVDILSVSFFRLDVGHQLIQPASTSRSPSSSQWGVPLPDNFLPSSLTLLSEPIDSKTLSRSSIRRAVVQLSAATDGSDGETGIRYATFQLQFKAMRDFDTETSASKLLPYVVLSRCRSTGEVRLCDPLASSTTVCGIFLAGASFTFDLAHKEEVPTVGSEEYVCTLGIIRSPGGGLHGVAVTSAGATVAAPVLTHGLKICDVPIYFLSDVILGGRVGESIEQEDTVSSYHAWTIERADGQMFCWFVPSTSGSRRQVR